MMPPTVGFDTLSTTAIIRWKRSRDVPPVRDDYAWDAAPGWQTTEWVVHLA